MRIISGKYRGRKLAEFEGTDIRPTSDRAREAVFSVLGGTLTGKSFYDAFCGSGAVGIEAVSRGADVVFTDLSAKSVELCKKNLACLGEKAPVINSDCLTYLKKTDKKFDVIFLDPPYKSEDGEKALKIIAERGLLENDGVIVYERGAEYQGVTEGLFVQKRKKYGVAHFAFLNKVDELSCVFAGSFDPVTEGHKEVVARALEKYKKVVVALGVNEEKQYCFSHADRLDFLGKAFSEYENVEVTAFDGLLVDFLKSRRITDNVRGLRNEKDREYEEKMFEFNKKLFPELKNVYIDCGEKFRNISSTAAREMLEKGENADGVIASEAYADAKRIFAARKA